MRFVMLYRSGRGEGSEVEGGRRRAAGLVDEMSRAGVVPGSAGLQAPPTATRVRIRGGELLVTDLTAPPSSGALAGYAVVQVGTRERAIELARRFLAVMDDGASEVRLVEAPAA